MTSKFLGRLGLQQRVLPGYRVPFFDMLAAACEGGLSVFAGEPRADEGIRTGSTQVARHARARNIHILRGGLYLCHQRGLAAWLEAWDPAALIVEANPRYLATPAAVRWMHARGRPSSVGGWAHLRWAAHGLRSAKDGARDEPLAGATLAGDPGAAGAHRNRGR